MTIGGVEAASDVDEAASRAHARQSVSGRRERGQEQSRRSSPKRPARITRGSTIESVI